MSKKEYRKLIARLMSEAQAANQRAQQKSPWEIEAEKKYTDTKKFLDSRDYRNLPTGVHIPMMGLAEANKMRQMTRGANAGQSAGGVNPQILAAQRELSDNQFAQDWGGEYEAKVGGLMDANDQNLGFLQNAHANRMGAGQSGSLSLMNAAQMLKPTGGGFWSSFGKGLLSGGANAALSFI